jgi:transposase
MDKDSAAGVEISRDELLVFARGSAQRVWRKRFANTPQGHQALRRWLRRLGGTVRVAMESTGTYGLDLALVLASEDPLEVIQPIPATTCRDAASAPRFTAGPNEQPPAL